MDNINRLKDIGFSKLSSHTDYPLEEGYQECPFCKKENKMRLRGNTYKCFYPSCNRSGDIFKYVQDLKHASNFKESVQFLSRKEGIKNFSAKDFYRLTKIRRRCFKIYKELLASSAADYLLQRGLSLKNAGYAPKGTPLYDAGVSVEDLKFSQMGYEKNGMLIEYYEDRVVFPVEDCRGNLVHLHARSLEAEADIRWKATMSADIVKPVSDYLYNYKEAMAYAETGKSVLCICEGVSDTESLRTLSLPAVGTFGINVDLMRHIDLLSRFKTIVVLMDGDRYPLGSSMQNQYKSWSQITPYLVNLKTALQEATELICCPPPSGHNIKDVNDWLLTGELDRVSLTKHVMNTGRSLENFLMDEFWQDIKYHKMIIELSESLNNQDFIAKLNHKILEFSKGDLVKYIGNVVG